MSQVRFQAIAALTAFMFERICQSGDLTLCVLTLDWGPVQTKIDRRPAGQGGCHLDRPNGIAAMCAFFYETSLSKWHPIGPPRVEASAHVQMPARSFFP